MSLRDCGGLNENDPIVTLGVTLSGDTALLEEMGWALRSQNLKPGLVAHSVTS